MYVFFILFTKATNFTNIFLIGFQVKSSHIYLYSAFYNRLYQSSFTVITWK